MSNAPRTPHACIRMRRTRRPRGEPAPRIAAPEHPQRVLSEGRRVERAPSCARTFVSSSSRETASSACASAATAAVLPIARESDELRGVAWRVEWRTAPRRPAPPLVLPRAGASSAHALARSSLARVGLAVQLACLLLQRRRAAAARPTLGRLHELERPANLRRAAAIVLLARKRAGVRAAPTSAEMARSGATGAACSARNPDAARSSAPIRSSIAGSPQYPAPAAAPMTLAPSSSRTAARRSLRPSRPAPPCSPSPSPSASSSPPPAEPASAPLSSSSTATASAVSVSAARYTGARARARSFWAARARSAGARSTRARGRTHRHGRQSGGLQLGQELRR
jgi:hypothetical protein